MGAGVQRALRAAAGGLLAMTAGWVVVGTPGAAAAAEAPEVRERAGVTVRVEHMMYLPGQVEVELGGRVTWAFPEITRHTTTSDQGFWHSGPRASGGSFARTFTSAGTFGYHCALHPAMVGRVRVGLRVQAPSEGRRVVRWATVRGGGAVTYDVQLRVGDGRWTPFRTATVSPRAVVRAADVGTDRVVVRARTSRGERHSGWSRPLRLSFP